jgi:hypothetical protein
VKDKRREIEDVLEFFIVSKERENKQIPSHKDLKKKLSANNSHKNDHPQSVSFMKNMSFDPMSGVQTPGLFSLDQLPAYGDDGNVRISEQLNLNLSKLNDNSQKNNIRIIRQFEHKLNKQKEVNRDLRVEKDMYTIKLEEAEKRLKDLVIT